MDPSMNTEPHSKTYQQEHNSPRLQNEKKKTKMINELWMRWIQAKLTDEQKRIMSD